MSFVSLPFVFFVAAVLLAYYLVPKRVQWVVLLVASYIFYFLNSEWLVLVMLFTTAVTFFAGKAVYAINQKGRLKLENLRDPIPKGEKKRIKEATKKQARRAMLVGVVIDLCILLFLKYFNFFAGNVNHILALFTDWQFPKLGLLLPLGISFYTLQAIGYIIDIYRNKYEPDGNLLKFMLFMSYFPQIVQGPIPRHDQLASQLYAEHKCDFSQIGKGAQLALWGLFKKLVVADRFAVAFNTVYQNSNNYSGMIIFFITACYGIQIYADFSGGTDISRGISQMFGVDLEQNFCQPYFSRSLEEFWRRWHITLGGWMRDYVFYPMSLSKFFTNLSKRSRKLLGEYVGKRLPPLLAMFLVYLLVGFWHGSSWKYVAYGIWNGTIIASGILLTDVYAKMRAKCGIDDNSICWRIFQMIRTYCICTIGRIISEGKGFRVALHMLKSMTVHWQDLSFLVNGSLLNLGLRNADWILFIFASLLILAVDILHERNIHIRETIARQHIVFRWIIYYIAIFSILIFGMYGPDYDQASFIYEQY